MIKNKTKILLLDIENAPNVSYTWGKYEQDVIDFQKEWYMLSYAYKWLGDKNVKVASLPMFGSYKKDKTNDGMLLMTLWKLLDEADIVIGHNVDRFDIRKINARFLAQGFSPPSPYKTIDTLKVARKYFFLNSNKLAHLSKFLGMDGKVETGGFQLWLDCMAGDKKAWKLMEKYNKHDIELLENVYMELRKWINNHPNVNIVSEKLDSCPICGSDKIMKRGFNISRTGKTQRYQCKNCYGWSSGKHEKLLEIR